MNIIKKMQKIVKESNFKTKLQMEKIKQELGGVKKANTEFIKDREAIGRI